MGLPKVDGSSAEELEEEEDGQDVLFGFLIQLLADGTRVIVDVFNLLVLVPHVASKVVVPALLVSYLVNSDWIVEFLDTERLCNGQSFFWFCVLMSGMPLALN